MWLAKKIDKTVNIFADNILKLRIFIYEVQVISGIQVVRKTCTEEFPVLTFGMLTPVTSFSGGDKPYQTVRGAVHRQCLVHGIPGSIQNFVPAAKSQMA